VPYINRVNAQHSKAGQYVQSGFFNDLKSLAELNQKISALSTLKAQGDAFEVFVEAYLAIKFHEVFYGPDGASAKKRSKPGN
jgi:hypothetical protein